MHDARNSIRPVSACDLRRSKQYKKPGAGPPAPGFFLSENPKNFPHSTRFDRQKIPALI